ncbi:MAG TPA: CHRD domain-containing protein, partial [Blastocatellia bacterium]|nr:CHRD domain-containing protein [Blastocatellia bacterium]
LSETMGTTVALTTAEEIGPSAPLPTNAFGSATATINPFRRPSDGAIIGGAINFVTTLNLPPNSVVTGFHIHEAAAGSNGAIVLDSSLSGSNSVSLPTGQGTLSFPIRLTTPAQIGALQRLMANPANFYFNVHTSANGSGVVRGQLRSLGAPPLIQQADTTFMTTGTTSAIMGMSVAWFNLGGSVMINGQQVQAYANLPSGDLTVIVPAAMRQNPGILWVQAQNFLGQRSMPYAVVVAPQNMVNSFPVTTVDSAKFGNLVSPESMASAFGTRLAMQTMGAPTIPLPYSLAGTRVYVNGMPAPLFYVSGAQVNYLIPWETFVGPGSVVVVSQDGTVSLGNLIMASTAPGVFTRLGNGSGAPNALSSPDGVTYTQVSNDDGTPRMINVGDYLVLFGGGWRYASTDMNVMIDNMSVPVAYRGPQGEYPGMDQINVQIPQALAGRGLVNLTVAVDGRPSNTVQINIR